MAPLEDIQRGIEEEANGVAEMRRGYERRWLQMVEQAESAEKERDKAREVARACFAHWTSCTEEKWALAEANDWLGEGGKGR